MADSRKALGDRGEAFALAVYERAGYRRVACKYRSPYGEVDLIVELDDVVVFVEVKTRRVGSVTTPAEAVGYTKQQRIGKTALYYLSQTGEKRQPRFDVFELYVQNDSPKRYRMLKNAFAPRIESL